MKDFEKYNDLFDCYKELLTEHEQNTFLDYYAEDLSLKEIAENNRVSRSAVQKTIKIVTDKLDDYESKLHLRRKNTILNNCLLEEDINKIKNNIEEILK